VTSAKAELLLGTPLHVGDNPVSVQIDRPQAGRDEQVQVVVPLAHRLHPDTASLSDPQPSVRVLAEAAPGVSIAIDGKPVALAADGTASVTLDLGDSVQGPADETKVFEKSLSYQVTYQGGVTRDGVLPLKIGITLLHVDAPLGHPVIASDRFVVAGRTARGANVSYALLTGEATAVAPGRLQPVSVDADGAFAQTIAFDASAPRAGEMNLTLRAQLPGQAPRFTSVPLRRATNLTEEAARFSATSKLSVGDLVRAPASHVGEPVSIVGEVVDARSQNHETALLLAAKGCDKPPCVVRVVSAPEITSARGDRIQVLGRVSRELNGTPEIEAALVLPRH
jgi:hypothetical protein